MQADVCHFNPRAHEGHDPWVLHRFKCILHFNPRAHEGHDFSMIFSEAVFVFQSTCPRGARLSCCVLLLPPAISIHVPTRGTTSAAAAITRPFYFNPRAHEGHDTRPR